MGIFSTLIVAAISLHYFKSNVEEDIASHLLSVQNIQKHRIESFISHTEERIRLISSRTQLRKTFADALIEPSPQKTERMLKILSDALDTMPDHLSISLLDKSGKVIVSTNQSRTGKNAGYQYKDMKEFPPVKPIEIDGQSRLILQAIAPIKAEDHIAGMVEVRFYATRLYSIVNDYEGLGKSGETILAERMPDGSARFLTPLRFDAHAALKRSIPANRHDVPIILATQGKTSFQKSNVVDYRDVPVLASTSYLTRAKWGLLIKIDESEAYAAYNNLVTSFFVITPVLMLVILLGAAWLSRSITRPIEHLTTTSKLIRDGDHNQSFNELIATDIETFELTQAFNDLALELLETFDAAANGMVIIDNKGSILRVNRALLGMFGYSSKNIIGCPIEVLVPSANKEKHRELRDSYLKSPTTRPMSAKKKLSGKRCDGREFPIEVALSPIETSSRTLVLATIADITKQVRYEKMLLEIANNDSLTGLPNRRLFMELLEKEIRVAQRYSKNIWLFFLDLDGFKKINDTLGHDAGDQLLVQTATRLTSSLRNVDTIARLGGDEFVVLLESNTREKYITTLAQTIIENCSRSIRIRGEEVTVSVSLGIANYPEDASSASELLEMADKAMYEVKKQGKNNFGYLSPSKTTQERLNQADPGTDELDTTEDETATNEL